MPDSGTILKPLTISVSSLAESIKLTVDSRGVLYQKSALIREKREFRFDEIECILLSPTHILSFQVGTEIFKIPVNMSKPKHMQFIDTFVAAVRNAD